jgi:hypothetical protein
MKYGIPRGLFKRRKTRRILRKEKCWFYISIDLHARKINNIIKNNVFCIVRCCPNDKDNRGSLSEIELDHISSMIAIKSIDEISNMTIEDVDETIMRDVFDSIEENNTTKQLFSFSDKTCPIFEPWCGNIVDKFMGLNKGEEISLEEDDTKRSGFQLLGLSDNIEKYRTRIKTVLDNLNKNIVNINYNEFGCEESGEYFSEILKIIKTEIVGLLRNFIPVGFILDTSCNGSLKEEVHCELASKGAFGGY